ncbi:hypothetical protein CIB48_g6687 [Xylaria polymorpha]|nr:hypothetical protein CIB48_g6687 [Xylaria polymorpha]
MPPTNKSPSPGTHSSGNKDLEHLWWLILMPLFIALFVVCCGVFLTFCRAICSKKRDKEPDEEVASEQLHPLQQAKTEMGTESSKKGPPQI